MPKSRKSQFLRMKNSGTASESDCSMDSSPSIESFQGIRNNTKKGTRRNSEWEILEGLKEGQRFNTKPEIFSGYLHKKRKWPLKGWHKRYFILDKGILTYGKGPSEIARGKIHGQVDIGLSVISTKYKRKRIDIDADEFIHHLKAKHYEIFVQWVEQLKKHRLYRQHVLTFGDVKHVQGRILRNLNKPIETSSTPARLTAWLIDSNAPLETAKKEMEDVQEYLEKFAKIFEQLNSFFLNNELMSSFASFLTRNSKENLSNSNPSLNNSTRNSRPASLSAPISSNKKQSEALSRININLHNDFIVLAKDIHRRLQSIMQILNNERVRLRSVVETDSSNGPYQTTINNLQNELLRTIQQNNELRTKLNKIHSISDTSDSVEPTPNLDSSFNSVYVSAPDIFFDAEEFPAADNESVEGATGSRTAASDSSSEAGSIDSEEGSVSSENSDGTVYDYDSASQVNEYTVKAKSSTGYREKLPCPRPSMEGLSLWSLLRKNIGVDLSRVSMPVALNEPLNMLQRLCEELEYSDLLDKATQTEDPYERMAYVAAFAVSGYCSSYYRAGSKPFNPLLGETYECIREDRGFRFISEQVSHHPPVSVCHAESKNFIFWQDIRIKTKFWGKSMEFQPIGNINLKIIRADSVDHYRWNKVTTCVHNLFSGQRWVELSGELNITNLDRNISCKLTFVKPNYWSTKRHEVHGSVYDENGAIVHKLFGKWNESLYYGDAPSAKCIWRSGVMPENYELYYGFTKFAIELNDLNPELEKMLPCTDSRFRRDQRLLEEGNLADAETIKLQLEQMQRERRKEMEATNIQHEPKWFNLKMDEDGEEYWSYNGQYWEMRKNPGFCNMSFEKLW